MTSLRRLLLGLAALAPCLPAQVQPQHALALVNDPRSHGQVGDKLLSLNEAIQLSNQTLPLPRLSPEELKQVLGFGDVAFVDIDARTVPVLTLERDLDVVLDTAHGFICGGSFGTPTVDLQSTNGFVCDGDFVDFRNLILKGGRCGITINQTNTLYGSQLELVQFTGQTECGLRLLLTADNGDSRFNLLTLQFANMPIAMQILDTGRNRGLVNAADIYVTGFEASGVRDGIDIEVGPGGRTRIELERVSIDATGHALRIRRPNQAATRNVILRGVHVTCRGGTSGFQLDMVPGSTATTALWMTDVTGGMRLGTLGTDLAVQLEDSRIAGGLSVLGGATRPLALAGNRLTGGNVDLGTTGGSVTMLESILDATALSTQGSAPVRATDCRLINGSAQGLAAAPLALDRCHNGGAAIGANTTVTNAVPQPQLGGLEVVPLRPKLASVVEWRADLPPGLAGYWVFGLTEEYPSIGPRPWNVYLKPPSAVILPLPARNQDKLPIWIPNDNLLRGMDLMVQMIVVPDPGMQAPPVVLPPGRRFVIQG